MTQLRHQRRVVGGRRREDKTHRCCFRAARQLQDRDPERAATLFELALERSAPDGIVASRWHLDWIMSFHVTRGAYASAIEIGARALATGAATAEQLANPAGASTLGRAYLYRGDASDAATWLRAPNAPPLARATLLARIALWAERPEAALQLVEALRRPRLEYDAEDDLAYCVEAELLDGAARAGLRGDLATLRRLRARYEHDDHWTANAADSALEFTRTRHALAERLLRRDGRWTFAAATAAFQRIDNLGLLEQARALAFGACEDVLREVPDCPSVLYALAIAHRDLGAYDQALAYAERVRDDCGFQHDVAASILVAAEQPLAAITRGERAVAHRPWCPRVLDNLGYYLTRAGEPARALSIHHQVLARDPDYSWAHANLACAHLTLGDHDATLRHLRAALDAGHPSWRIAADPALEPLADLPAYHALMSEA